MNDMKNLKSEEKVNKNSIFYINWNNCHVNWSLIDFKVFSRRRMRFKKFIYFIWISWVLFFLLNSCILGYEIVAFLSQSNFLGPVFIEVIDHLYKVLIESVSSAQIEIFNHHNFKLWLFCGECVIRVQYYYVI